ncbi:uncharacterized protein LOC125503844 [Dendroctonus ponderosae]|nr:uncharacterized protein LOC125503844 [Dendroctonus ponderosae]KAH1024630.1 hypothetical protein HUJ05_004090 [Dendroctonus ponderosae]
MKCTKIVLTSRNAINAGRKNEYLEDRAEMVWSTKGYHGYSYKLAARTKEQYTPRLTEPKLTITTLLFPDNVTLNTGASLEKWSKKAPRLLSAKCKSFTPRKPLNSSIADDDYDFSYPLTDLFEQPQPAEDFAQINDDLQLNFDDYFVASDIEELMLKSERIQHELVEKPKKGDKTKKKRHKFKKTIRFSLSKPPSPETEQVIRVDVTSNVSFEDDSEIRTKEPRLSKGRNRTISECLKSQSMRKLDKNNNEKSCDGPKGDEDDFIVKCRQLALTQKKI